MRNNPSETAGLGARRVRPSRAKHAVAPRYNRWHISQGFGVVVYKDVQPLGSQVEGAFRPANSALRSHNKFAVLSFCASREGAIGRHL